MKVRSAQKKSKLLLAFVAIILVVLGVGLYAVRNDKLDEQWWQYDDPEISDAEQAYYLGLDDKEGQALDVNQVTNDTRSRLRQAADGTFGRGTSQDAANAQTSGKAAQMRGAVQNVAPFNCDLGMPQWPTSNDPGHNQLVACEKSVETQGECAPMVVYEGGGKGGGSCQAQRDPSKIPAEYIALMSADPVTQGQVAALASVSKAGCYAVAYSRWSWKAALGTTACQPGLLYNQHSITSDVFTDRYTGATKDKGINISGQHSCMPGLTGRKHPVATKGGETVNLDPGHPGSTSYYSANPGKSKLPDEGLQANIDAYRADGYTVTWEEYHTSPKGACECITERPAVIKDKGVVYCAKMGPAQINIEGSKACYKGKKPVFCCPTGKVIKDGKCVAKVAGGATNANSI